MVVSVLGHNTGTIPVEQKQPYDKDDLAENTGTIPVEQKQPYDKYDIAHAISYLS
jgi:acetyl-CoA carboxylase carboxyltransferase component